MTKRILLVEDNDSLSLMLSKFLLGKGFEPQIARTGAAAMEALSASDFDLVVLDLRLPVMSGVEVLQRLRTTPKWENLPVIVMSGAFKGPRYSSWARRLKVKHYLEKPFTPQTFLDAVQDVIAGTTKSPPRTLTELLLDIYNEGKNGILTIRDGSPAIFLNGEPVSFLSQGKLDFPAYLRSHGKIMAEDLQFFINSREERIFLTQSGILTYDELEEASRRFLQHKLTESLQLTTGFSFQECRPDVESPCFTLSLPRLLYEAYNNAMGGFAADGFVARCGSLYPARTPLFYRRVNLTALRDRDIEILGRIDGRRTLGEIVSGGGHPLATAGFLKFLLTMGMIELFPEPAVEALPGFPLKSLFNRPIESPETYVEEAPTAKFADLVEEFAEEAEIVEENSPSQQAPAVEDADFSETVAREHQFIQGKNYYELFDLDQKSFSFSALKDAYFSKTRLYSPDKFMTLSGPTLNMAQDILSVYASAYNALSNAVAKERYDELLNVDRVGLNGKKDEKLQARIQLQTGKVFLEMGDFKNAEKSLHDSYTLDSDNEETCAHLAWAIYRNPANRNSRVAQDRSRNLLARSLQIERNAEAYAYRGWMLLDEDRTGLAEGEFQRALKLNPGDINARKGLRLISEKREKEKKGFFGRLFG